MKNPEHYDSRAAIANELRVLADQIESVCDGRLMNICINAYYQPVEKVQQALDKKFGKGKMEAPAPCPPFQVFACDSCGSEYLVKVAAFACCTGDCRDIAV